MLNSAKRYLNVSGNNPRKYFLIALILLLPLLFLGNFSGHDWGDDFAQYIHQAANVVKGVPQSETGYVFRPENYIGPQAYPMGFPLMLAPLYAFAGNNITLFIVFISLIYIILGLLIYKYYQQSFGALTALLLMLIYIYNPYMVQFKQEVMSDIPFTALLVILLILYKKTDAQKIMGLLLTGALIGFAVTVRPAGMVLLPAIFVDKLLHLIHRKISRTQLGLFVLTLILLPLAFYYMLNSVIFDVPSGGSVGDYSRFTFSGNLLWLVPENIYHHLEVFRYYYMPEMEAFKGFSLLLASMVITMSFIGFVKKLTTHAGVTEWFFLFYMLMLLVFPNNLSAFRLMVPLGFLFVSYAAIGLQSINLRNIFPRFKKLQWLSVPVLALFIPGLVQIAANRGKLPDGPQTKSAMEMFSYLDKNIPKQAVIVFAKPRALALYAGCTAMADPFTTDPTKIYLQMLDSRAEYLLIHNKLTSPHIQRFTGMVHDRIVKQYQNRDFTLYRLGF